MTIQKIIPKSEKSLKPTAKVIDFDSIYIQQAITDLLDTLRQEQLILDEKFPGKGAGVGLAANQIDYPYEPISDLDDSPKPGFYPKDFTPPDIYVISIRAIRAEHEKCETIAPQVCINATFTPLDGSEQSFHEEACLSVTGFQGFKIPRSESILIEAWDRDGKQMRFEAHGFVARVHQHEQDHGLGMEYLNRLNFTEDELKSILQWLEMHTNKPVLKSFPWVVQDKLLCVSEPRDDKALAIWARNALALIGDAELSVDEPLCFRP